MKTKVEKVKDAKLHMDATSTGVEKTPTPTPTDLPTSDEDSSVDDFHASGPSEKWLKRYAEISLEDANPTCRGCGKEITSRYRPFNGYAWHPQCLKKRLHPLMTEKNPPITMTLKASEILTLLEVMQEHRITNSVVKMLYDTLAYRLFAVDLALVPCGWITCKRPVNVKESIRDEEVQKMLRFLSLISGSRTTKVLRFCSQQHANMLKKHLAKKLQGFPLADDAFTHLVEGEQKRREAKDAKKKAGERIRIWKRGDRQ